MSNWWLAASSEQCAHSCITSHAVFFGKTSNYPGDSALLQPRFGTLWLLAFPQTKITFEREEISDHWWDSGKYNGAANGDWENCVRSQGAYFEGDWGVIVQCFLYLQEMSLFFITHGWIPSGQTSYIWAHFNWEKEVNSIVKRISDGFLGREGTIPKPLAHTSTEGLLAST